MQMLITQHLVCHAVSFPKKNKKSVARMFENCGEKKGKKRENCEAKPILPPCQAALDSCIMSLRWQPR